MTPLYNPWQYGNVTHNALPLYIEDCHIMGESENIPTSLIVCAVRPPIDKIIHFNNVTNKFEALGKKIQCILLFAKILVFMQNLYYRKSHVSLPLMP